MRSQREAAPSPEPAAKSKPSPKEIDSSDEGKCRMLLPYSPTMLTNDADDIIGFNEPCDASTPPGSSTCPDRHHGPPPVLDFHNPNPPCPVHGHVPYGLDIRCPENANLSPYGTPDGWTGLSAEQRAFGAEADDDLPPPVIGFPDGTAIYRHPTGAHYVRATPEEHRRCVDYWRQMAPRVGSRAECAAAGARGRGRAHPRAAARRGPNPAAAERSAHRTRAPTACDGGGAAPPAPAPAGGCPRRVWPEAAPGAFARAAERARAPLRRFRDGTRLYEHPAGLHRVRVTPAEQQAFLKAWEDDAHHWRLRRRAGGAAGGGRVLRRPPRPGLPAAAAAAERRGRRVR